MTQTGKSKKQISNNKSISITQKQNLPRNASYLNYNYYQGGNHAI